MPQFLPVDPFFFFVLDQLVLEMLLPVDSLLAGLRQPVDGVQDEVEAVQIVQHRHVEGGSDRTLFLVAAEMDVIMVGSAPLGEL
jgi:hypothetical protein